MHSPDLFRVFTDRLNDLGVVYMVTGSVATIVYGEPRLTHDIDIVLRLSEREIPDLERAFPLEEFTRPSTQTLRLEARRATRGHFYLIHHETGFKADIYTEGRDVLHLWAIEKRRQLDISGARIWIAPPEYVIIRKLEFYTEGGSEKHLRDISSMLGILDEPGIAEIEKHLGPKALAAFHELLEGNTREQEFELVTI